MRREKQRRTAVGGFSANGTPPLKNFQGPRPPPLPGGCKWAVVPMEPGRGGRRPADQGKSERQRKKLVRRDRTGMAPIGRAGPGPAGWDCTHDHAHAACLPAHLAAVAAPRHQQGERPSHDSGIHELRASVVQAIPSPSPSGAVPVSDCPHFFFAHAAGSELSTSPYPTLQANPAPPELYGTR